MKKNICNILQYLHLQYMIDTLAPSIKTFLFLRRTAQNRFGYFGLPLPPLLLYGDAEQTGDQP